MNKWQEGQEELYEWTRNLVEEWYAMKVVDDRQYIALLKVLNEMRINVFYEPRRDDEILD